MAQEPAANWSIDDWKNALLEGHIDERRSAAIATLDSPDDIKAGLVPVFVELLRSESDGQMRLAVFDTLISLGPPAEKAIPSLAFAMQNRFGGRRNEELHQDYRAALALAAIGPASVETLRNLLRDDEENIRAESAMALGRIGSAAAPAIPDLIRLLSDGEQRVRDDASQALRSIGAAALQPLLNALEQGESVPERAAALAALPLEAIPAGSLSDVRERVLNALEDSDASVRRAGAAALPFLGLNDAELQTEFVKHLGDPDKFVRSTVLNMMVERPEMIRNAQTDLSSLLLHDDPEVAKHAAFLLQTMEAKAVPLLIANARDSKSHLHVLAQALAAIGPASIETVQNSLDDPNLRIQNCAALTLGYMRPISEELVQTLADKLGRAEEGQEMLLVEAVSLLGQRARPALPSVKPLLKHPDSTVRVTAMQTLFAAGEHNQQLANDLAGMLDDNDAEVRMRALATLTALGPLAIPSIHKVTQLLNDENEDVRMAAAQMLGSQGDAAGDALPALLDLLGASSPETQIALLEILSQLGVTARPALPVLRDLLTNEDARLRAAALNTIARLRLSTEEIQPILLAALQDPDEDVRDRAYSGLRRSRESAIPLVPKLIVLLANERAGEQAERVLERLSEYAIPASMLPELRRLLADSLASGGQDPAEPQRKQTLSAVQFIGLVGAPAEQAISDLAPLLEHPDQPIAEAAKTAIENIKGQPSPSES